MERQRAAAVRRLAAVAASYLGNHSTHLWRATELNPGGVRRRAPRPATPTSAACCILAEPGAGAVLRHDRPARRHRPRQLQRPAAVGAAPPEEQPERAVELDDVEVHDAIRPRRKSPGRRSSIRTIPISTTRYCSSDRRHVVNVSRRRAHAAFSSNGVLNARVQRLAVVAARAVAERQPLDDHDRRRQRADRHGRPAGGADPRRSVRRRHAGQLPESRRLHVAGRGHLQHAGAVHDRQPVAPPERPGGHAHVQGRRARRTCSSAGRSST